MCGKDMKINTCNKITCLRPNGLKQARKEKVGGEVIACAW